MHLNARAFVALILLTPVVAAQTPPRIIPPLSLEYTPAPLVAVPVGEDKIVALRLSEPAPFSGQLLDASTAVRWTHYMEQARLRLAADVIYERRVCNATMDYYEHRVLLEREASNAIEQDLRNRLVRLEQHAIDLQKELVDPGLFRSPTFWFFMGVVTSGVALGVSAYTLGQLQ